MSRFASRTSRPHARSFRRERRRSSTSATGSASTLVEAPTDVEYDLDHVALRAADPEATAEAYERYGFEPAGAGSASRSAAPTSSSSTAARASRSGRC